MSAGDGAAQADEPPSTSGPVVAVIDEQTVEPVDRDRWAHLARAVLELEGAGGDVTVVFVEEQRMTELNRRFMGATGPTDVLAFPIDGDEVTTGPALLGDVVICPAVARRNAPDHAGTYDDEVALLLVHGLLHLLGMDHAEDSERIEMQARERDLLDRCYRV